MSESEDSKEVDNSVSIPENRLPTLLHSNLATDQMKALQAIVRNQKHKGGKVMSIKTDFETETEDEANSKMENKEDNELGDLNDTLSKTYQNETEDDISTLKKR